MKDIAGILGCSLNKVKYWMNWHGIKIRSISEAIYLKNHPDGDPFRFIKPRNRNDFKLLGLGLGLYWGEGHKKNKVSVRLGNTDPILIRNFMEFLVKICGVDKNDITFHLMIFNDIDPDVAKKFWIQKLKIMSEQIRGKITILKSKKSGTYRQKAKYGVIILQYHNKKLRDIINNLIDNLK